MLTRDATGGPRYRTTIATSASGYEQRNSEWDNAQYRFTFSLQGYNPSVLAGLLAFFHARAGAAYGFRFKDWSDFYAGLKWTGETPEFDAPHAFATGNGSATTFQLKKRYVSGSITRERKITKPVSGTIRIWKNGVELTSGWTLDYLTGIVTFSSAPTNGHVLAWAGEFDVPCRFETDDMDFRIAGLQNGEWQSVSLVGLKD